MNARDLAFLAFGRQIAVAVRFAADMACAWWDRRKTPRARTALPATDQ